NANMPNRGQMEGMPLGAIVETNVKFTKDSIKPMYAGGLSAVVQSLVYKAYAEEELAFSAGFYGDYENAFKAIISDQLANLDFKNARSLFNEMLENNKDKLPYYEDFIKSIK
ncbi:MAG: alpha-glucosidase/alpha-galactosidase, partial [Clostridia bacterium]|nr:alpha-glucosidase/alpha-galactosidase [Clostridia bacterium]